MLRLLVVLLIAVPALARSLQWRGGSSGGGGGGGW
jgi:hypothetical protein